MTTFFLLATINNITIKATLALTLELQSLAHPYTQLKYIIIIKELMKEKMRIKKPNTSKKYHSMKIHFL